MSTPKIILDAAMCLLWVTTYALVLISTLKTRTAAMPVIACVFIFPWEFVATVKNFAGSAEINYAFLAHLFFAILDLAIFCVLFFKLREYSRPRTVGYILLTMFNAGLLSYVFTVPNGMFYTSYIVTIVGTAFWIIHTAKPSFLRTKLNLTFLLTKLTADILAIFVYYDYDIVGLMLSVLLPILEIIQVAVFFKSPQNNTSEAKPLFPKETTSMILKA